MIDSFSMTKAALESGYLAVQSVPAAVGCNRVSRSSKVVLWLLAAVRQQIDNRLHDFIQPLSYFPGHSFPRF